MERDEPLTTTSLFDESSAEKARQNAGKVAVATMLATSLTAAPPSQSDYPLPDTPPIVRVMDLGAGDALPAIANDLQDEGRTPIWKKV